MFIEWGADMVYGLPVPAAGHGETFKVSHHTPASRSSSTRWDPAPRPLPDDAALLAVLTGAVSRLLPALDPVPVATERCVYDNSADGDLVLDRVGRVVVGCGSSGHGFKFGPLVGEVLADLAEGVRRRRGRRALRPGPARPGARLPGMARHVALLRSVNVAGHGRVAMDELRVSFGRVGFGDVTTYIQTGNVLFTTPKRSEKALVAAIEAQLAADFGTSPAVIVRSVDDLDAHRRIEPLRQGRRRSRPPPRDLPGGHARTVGPVRAGAAAERTRRAGGRRA